MSEFCFLIHVFEQIAEAVDDHLMADDQYAFARILARDRVEHIAQSQDHVAPAFAAGWTEIELSDMLALLMQLGMFLRDAETS
jgi:hypothetical protein